MARTALILGAGLGGIVAAQRLRRALPRSDRVVLIDRAAQHLFPPSLPWLLVGKRQAPQISRPLQQLGGRGIEFIRGEVTQIRPQERAVEVDGRTLQGDALIVALGAEYNLTAVPGLAQAGHCLYTPDGASAGHAALCAFNGGRIVILTAAPAYKCPAAPYEAALLVEADLRRRGKRERAQIYFYAAEPQPMVVAGPDLGAAVRGMLEARGIRYSPEHQVTAVDASARRLTFANGASAEFNVLFYVPPHRAPAAIRESGLANESGWIPVDRHRLKTRFAGVYAIGDVTTIPLKMGRPLPKAGVFAHAQAEVVAHNLAVAWTGRGASRQFSGDGACFIESGGGRAAMAQGNFYAEPLPAIKMRTPSLLWHAAKVLFEKHWLFTRFEGRRH